MESAFIGSPITKKAEHDPIKGLHPGGQGGAHGNGYPAADDPIGTQVTHLNTGNVHASALSLAITGLLAQKFGHHPVNVHALADTLTMTPMGDIDQILFCKGTRCTNAGSFLTDTKMGGPMNLA